MRVNFSNLNLLPLSLGLALFVIGCGGSSNEEGLPLTQSFERSTANGLKSASLDETWELVEVDGEVVGAEGKVHLVFQEPGEILVEDPSSCRGLLPVIAGADTLELGEVRSRGCFINYLADSNQVILAEEFRNNSVPYTFDGQNLILLVGDVDYVFVLGNE